MEHLGLQSVNIAACIVLACPARAQFGPKQTLFRDSVLGWTGTLDVHGVASGQVTGPAGTQTYKTDQHFSGLLKLDTYNRLTGAWVGTLEGTITVTETSTITFACTITNTYTAGTTAQTDSNGQPLNFNITFDSGSDTWSLWPRREPDCPADLQLDSGKQPHPWCAVTTGQRSPLCLQRLVGRRRADTHRDGPQHVHHVHGELRRPIPADNTGLSHGRREVDRRSGFPRRLLLQRHESRRGTGAGGQDSPTDLVRRRLRHHQRRSLVARQCAGGGQFTRHFHRSIRCGRRPIQLIAETRF